MNTTKMLRADIMELLFEVDNEAILQSLYQQLKTAVQKEPKPKHQNDDDILAIAKEPIPEYISPEQIAKEQGITSSEGFWKIMENWDYSIFEDELLEDMLNTLTK